MTQAKLSVGNVEILALLDGESTLPITKPFPDVAAETWTPYRQRFPETFIGTDRIRAVFMCYLLRSQGRTILFDTGLGSNSTNPGTVAAMFDGKDSSLLTELQSIGVRTEDVDMVFHSHLHPDHVGWNLSPSGSSRVPTFANARYVVHQTDWDVFKSPHDEELFGFTFWNETIGPLEDLGLIDLITGEHSLTSEITAIPTPGHTPGHMSLAIVSSGERALVLGDVFDHPAQVTQPDWECGFDMDPPLGVETRTRMFDRAEAENAVMAGSHHSGFGKVVRVEGHRYWQGL